MKKVFKKIRILKEDGRFFQWGQTVPAIFLSLFSILKNPEWWFIVTRRPRSRRKKNVLRFDAPSHDYRRRSLPPTAACRGSLAACCRSLSWDILLSLSCGCRRVRWRTDRSAPPWVRPLECVFSGTCLAPHSRVLRLPTLGRQRAAERESAISAVNEVSSYTHLTSLYSWALHDTSWALIWGNMTVAIAQATGDRLPLGFIYDSFFYQWSPFIFSNIRNLT